MKSNILIIGSKGFIGSHCVTYFEKNHHVFQCDVVTDYTSKNYFIIDATNADYNDIFQKLEFDVCINCSGAASVSDSITNSQRDFMLNTVNVFKQLHAIRLHNPSCKYINLSSAAVYGNPQHLPIAESHPLHPISPYGVHKLLAENICKEFYDIYGLKTCSLRIFSAYGEGLQKQLFWDLHQKANKKQNVTLFGTGNESRDFIYIKDLMHAIDLVIQKASFENNIINVATGIEASIKDVAEIFYNLYRPEIQIEFQGQGRRGDPINWVGNIQQLKDLGFKPEVTMTEGLTNYISWLEENK